jgi:hypothetical protein
MSTGAEDNVSEETVMKNRRRLVLVPLAAAAVVLAFASVAYACTTITGTITTTKGATTCPNSGGSLCQVSTGTTITSTGNSLGSPSTTLWGLYFLRYKSNSDTMNTCMGKTTAREQKVGTQSDTEGTDNSVTISGAIPGPRLLEPSGTGNARVCLISENALKAPNYSWGTPPTELVLV